MRTVLLTAGVYNIVWGGLAVVFPNTMFDWMGMPRPNYPQLWQCIGMIVGLYGLGYAIAAHDPVRHWPIVLVGLLGKVFGPLGMLQALWEGALPWVFALNCVTNDLIWWVPFALILRHAWECHLKEGGDELPNELTLLRETVASSGESLAAMSEREPVLLVLLRHSGCTFCREALSDLRKKRAELERVGTRLVLGHMGDAASFARFASRYGLGDLAAVADPERRLYRGLGLRRGTLGQLFGWSVWTRGARAFFSGHGVGGLVGDGLQMPGVFLIHRGSVVKRYVHETAADRPEYEQLCEVSAS